MSNIKHDTGRPPLLQLAEELRHIAHTADLFQGGSPVFPKQVCSYVIGMIRKQVSSSPTWWLVKHHRRVLQRATAYPYEDPHMRVSKKIPRARVQNLEQYVEDIPTELVLNVDEVGCQK
jgi:hypothetical protein